MKLEDINIGEVPELPERVEYLIQRGEMVFLEQMLRETNAVFEKDLYLGILKRLAVVYYVVNHFGGEVKVELIRSEFIQWDEWMDEVERYRKRYEKLVIRNEK